MKKKTKWATPRAGDGSHGGPNARNSDGSLHLSAQVIRSERERERESRYPTPRANDGEKRGKISDDPRNGLPGLIENMDKDEEKWATKENLKPTADSRQPTAELADSPHSEFVRRERERGDDRQTEGGWDHFQRGAHGDARWWETEPGMGRVVDGLAYRVDRLRLTGNGVVPQQAAVSWARIKEIAESN